MQTSSSCVCQVKTVPENIGTAEAVRHVAGSIKTEHFVLLSADLVSHTHDEALPQHAPQQAWELMTYAWTRQQL